MSSSTNTKAYLYDGWQRIELVWLFDKEIKTNLTAVCKWPMSIKNRAIVSKKMKKMNIILVLNWC